jgi:hypothetical protein
MIGSNFTEEFAIEIPDEDADRITTVGEGESHFLHTWFTGSGCRHRGWAGKPSVKEVRLTLADGGDAVSVLVRDLHLQVPGGPLNAVNFKT